MASSPHPTTSIKEYNARTAAIVVGGNRIEDISTFSFSQSKGHDPVKTIDQNGIWVMASSEMSGSVEMHATSPSIPVLDAMWKNNQIFDITAQPAETESRGPVHFVGCMITDFDTGDYEDSEMPTVTAEWEGMEMS